MKTSGWKTKKKNWETQWGRLEGVEDVWNSPVMHSLLNPCHFQPLLQVHLWPLHVLPEGSLKQFNYVAKWLFPSLSVCVCVCLCVSGWVWCVIKFHFIDLPARLGSFWWRQSRSRSRSLKSITRTHHRLTQTPAPLCFSTQRKKGYPSVYKYSLKPYPTRPWTMT